MKYATALALLALATTLSCFGQAASTDSQTLQAILVEMRGLHNDVRLSQTTQILLTELEVQQTAVNRAMQRHDDAKSNLAQNQSQQRNVTSEIARFDETVNSTADPEQKKHFAQMVEELKRQLANLKNLELDRANDQQDAETTLRKEQDTLAGIQEQLNAVVRKLQPVANP